jgi:hypothetical protein
LEAEARGVWELYKKGVIREIYFRADRTSAVLILECENLEEAQKIASLITHITQSKNKTGRVLVLAASRLSEIYLFLEYADKYQKGESISYSINDNENPYIFSCLLKEDDYMSLETLKERFRNYALDRLIEVSKISKLKNMSPHDIIEQEYQ